MSLCEPFVAQEISIRARHELHVGVPISVKVDPPADQDLILKPGESALRRPLNEAASVDVLEEAHPAACSEEEVGVPVGVEVLPGTEAQVANACEPDLGRALCEVTVTGVQVEASLVLFVDDEEVEQPVRIEVTPSELDRGGACGGLKGES